MEAKFNINTSQNVNIELKIAGIGDRLMAILIDFLIIIGVGVALTTLLTLVKPSEEINLIIFAIYGFLASLYHFFMEWWFKGQSIGKRYKNIKVIHKNGVDASVFQLLIRNLIRIIDSIYGLGLLVIFLSKKSQRLGDLAAGTLVVKKSEHVKFEETALVEVEKEYAPTFSKLEMLRLNEKDMEMIKEVTERDSMQINWKLVGLLASKIKTKAGIENNELKSLFLLQTILKDFQYYHTIE